MKYRRSPEAVTWETAAQPLPSCSLWHSSSRFSFPRTVRIDSARGSILRPTISLLINAAWDTASVRTMFFPGTKPHLRQNQTMVVIAAIPACLHPWRRCLESAQARVTRDSNLCRDHVRLISTNKNLRRSPRRSPRPRIALTLHVA